MDELDQLIRGRFLRELKNRFLCEVEIEGAVVECYIPSSCRISNFLELEGKYILLKKNKTTKCRTKLSVVAIPHKRNYLLLNSSYANRVIESCIYNRRFSFIGNRKNVCKEHYVEGYKTDIYIPNVNSIIEVKSLISLHETATYPTVHSARAYTQLIQLQELLQCGYSVYFFIVSLNPYVKKIRFDRYSKLFMPLYRCLNLGMQIMGFTCVTKGANLTIKGNIPIELDG